MQQKKNRIPVHQGKSVGKTSGCCCVKDTWLREALPLSHEVQKGFPWFLRSFSKRSLGAAGFNLSFRLGLCLKDYVYSHLLESTFACFRALSRTFSETVSQS